MRTVAAREKLYRGSLYFYPDTFAHDSTNNTVYKYYNKCLENLIWFMPVATETSAHRQCFSCRPESLTIDLNRQQRQHKRATRAPMRL